MTTKPTKEIKKIDSKYLDVDIDLTEYAKTTEVKTMISEALQSGGGGSGGEKSAIIDVIELPTTYINENIFYRLLTAKVVANGKDLTRYGYVCYCVNGLPEVGLPATNADQSTLNAYYNTQDGVVYGYIDETLSAFLGIPVNWYDMGMLMSSVGQPWGGVINDISEDPMDGSACILLTSEYYMHQDGWCNVPFAYEKAPKVDIRWDGDMTDRAVVDASAFDETFEGACFVKVSDDVFTASELIGWTIEIQVNDGASQSGIITENMLQEIADIGCIAIADCIFIMYDSDAFSTAFGIPNGTYTNGVYFMSHINDGYYISQLVSQATAIKIDSKYMPYQVAGKTFLVEQTDTIAQIGAEIFNDYTRNIATGAHSHAEGSQTEATGISSHAEGDWTVAAGDYSHAEGGETLASGAHSHAEGQGTSASGSYAHAEGHSTFAIGSASHAEGDWTIANYHYSHSEGYNTTTTGASQHVQGEYNIIDRTGGSTNVRGKYAHIVGNGTYSKRSNAHTLDWNGNAWFQGNVYVGGTGQDDPNAKRLLTEDDNVNVDLTDYAKVSDLANYAKTSDLTDYAKTSDLTSYAKTTDVETMIAEAIGAAIGGSY